MVLSATAAGLAFAHTLLGPDHYLPFVALSKARDWDVRKTLGVTLVCGMGHLAGSVILGLVGIYLGIQLAALEWLEGLRGSLAVWLLIGFGLAYTVWGLRQAYRNRPHRHWHSHGKIMHVHEHRHHSAHAHVHAAPGATKSLTPWLIFIIFVLGPCEPLIPLLMYPAARESAVGVLTVTAVFGTVTVLTMLLTVSIALRGLRNVKLKALEPYSQAMAGGAILTCGLAVAFLGI